MEADINMTLTKSLYREKNRHLRKHQLELLKEVQLILNVGQAAVPVLSMANTRVGSYSSKRSLLQKKKWDFGQVFTLAEIKGVAVAYHLRFLPLQKLKKALPYTTHIKCQALEIELDENLQFYVLAEALSFISEKSVTEHLVFVPLGEDNYFLLDSWGKSYNRMRKIVSYPFRSFNTLVITLASLSLIIMLVTPTSYIINDKSAGYWNMLRIAYFFHLVILLTATMSYYLMGIRKYLNVNVWNKSTFLY